MVPFKFLFPLEMILILWRKQTLADEGRPEHPRIMRWVAPMAHNGGDGNVVRYTPKSFDWLG